MKFFLFIVLLLPFTTLQSQTTPQEFEPGLISKSGEFGLTISPDSKTALWVQSNGKRDTLVIMQSTKKKGRWQQPVVASFSQSDGKWKDIDPMFSPDGKTVLFQSTRKVPGLDNRTGFDIWAVNKEKNGWSKAYHLGNTINSDSSESYASVASNGNIYFMKNNEDGIGSSDIYVSRFVNGQYTTPQNIGSPVNTKHRESNPYIAANEEYLLYFSSDPGGFGEVDLFISFNKNGQWTSPVNLGKPINSSLAEFCPFVHATEKRLYFSRQEKSTGRMVEKLFSIPFNVEDYRKQMP